MLFLLSKIRTLKWLFLFLFRSSSLNRAFKPAEPGMNAGTYRTPFQASISKTFTGSMGSFVSGTNFVLHHKPHQGTNGEAKGGNRGDVYKKIILSTLFKGAPS